MFSLCCLLFYLYYLLNTRVDVTGMQRALTATVASTLIYFMWYWSKTALLDLLKIKSSLGDEEETWVESANGVRKRRRGKGFWVYLSWF